jgi:GT2 family glycosyltransferase
LAILADFHARYPGRVLRTVLRHNLGTTFPRNLALRRVRGTHVCVLDSDTEMRDGRLDDVLWRLSESPDIGIMAPRLFTDDGRVQHSVKMFPTLWEKFLKLRRIFLRLKVSDSDFYSEFPFREPRDIDSAISACWLFKTELLRTVGLLDERIFYAPEDLDYCLRVWRSGYRIVYYPFLSVLHRTQQVSHRRPFSRVSLSHAAGLAYYFRKHGGWFRRINAQTRAHGSRVREATRS